MSNDSTGTKTRKQGYRERKTIVKKSEKISELSEQYYNDDKKLQQKMN